MQEDALALMGFSFDRKKSIMTKDIIKRTTLFVYFSNNIKNSPLLCFMCNSICTICNLLNFNRYRYPLSSCNQSTSFMIYRKFKIDSAIQFVSFLFGMFPKGKKKITMIKEPFYSQLIVRSCKLLVTEHSFMTDGEEGTKGKRKCKRVWETR